MNEYTLEQLGYAYVGSFTGALYILCEVSNACDFICPQRADIHIENDTLFIDIAITIYTKHGTFLLERSMHSSQEELTAGLFSFAGQESSMRMLEFMELQSMLLAKEMFARAQDIYKNPKLNKSNVIPLH